MKEVDRQTERKVRERKWENGLPTVRTGWVRPRVRLTVGAGFLARLFMPAISQLGHFHPLNYG